MPVSDIVFPRSPRESMAGWVWLPRFVYKIRLHLADQLHVYYLPNFCVKGFDKAWLDAAEVVTGTACGGPVAAVADASQVVGGSS